MAMECAKKIIKKGCISQADKELPLWDDSFVSKPTEESILISHNWADLRKIMWNYVGILR